MIHASSFKYEKHSKDFPNSNYKGYIGEPIYKNGYDGHDYKSDVVWQIIIKENPIEIIRVYNYKKGNLYV